MSKLLRNLQNKRVKDWKTLGLSTVSVKTAKYKTRDAGVDILFGDSKSLIYECLSKVAENICKRV